MSYTYFHLAEHRHVSGTDHLTGEVLYDSKRIGLFASRQDAVSAIAQVHDAPGFRDVPQGFEIRRVRVYLPEGMTKEDVREVYEAWHEFWDDEEQCDRLTECPLRAVRADAETDLAVLRTDPRLAAHPEGFDIAEILVGQVNWQEGYLPFDD